MSKAKKDETTKPAPPLKMSVAPLMLSSVINYPAAETSSSSEPSSRHPVPRLSPPPFLQLIRCTRATTCPLDPVHSRQFFLVLCSCSSCPQDHQSSPDIRDSVFNLLLARTRDLTSLLSFQTSPASGFQPLSIHLSDSDLLDSSPSSYKDCPSPEELSLQ